MALPPLTKKEKWGAPGRIVVVVRGGEKVPVGGVGQLQGYRRERGGPSRTFLASIDEGRMDDGQCEKEPQSIGGYPHIHCQSNSKGVK
jgi:hypothetical protein